MTLSTSLDLASIPQKKVGVARREVAWCFIFIRLQLIHPMSGPQYLAFSHIVGRLILSLPIPHRTHLQQRWLRVNKTTPRILHRAVCLPTYPLLGSTYLAWAGRLGERALIGCQRHGAISNIKIDTLRYVRAKPSDNLLCLRSTTY